jgi:SAM-dependent methyltransferase
MTVYAGTYAALYDLFYAEKPYMQEAAVVDRLMSNASVGTSRRLLDVACGTAQHAVSFAGLGWRVVGVDGSSDMLAVANKRASEAGVELVHQDMRRLQLRRRDFDAAVCLFDSIGYALSNDGIVDTLTGIRRHLTDDGLLAVEFWHAPAMLAGYDPSRAREWSTPDAVVVRTSETSLDVASQVATIAYRVHRIGRDGSYEAWDETHRNRFFLVQEFSLLLTVAGFRPIQWCAGYDVELSIDASTWHIVVLARVDARSDR